MTGNPKTLALDLLQNLGTGDKPARGSDLVELLEAWGFVREAGIDPENAEAVFMIHPRLPHLQMDIPSMGWVHSWVTRKAIDLASCARVH